MTEWLHHWLEPVTEQALRIQELNLGEVAHAAPVGGGEVAWAVISTLAALVVVATAMRVVGRQEMVPAAKAAQPTGFGKVLYNKWYVDEFYDRVIVQPILRASRFCWKVVDAGIIDGTVNAVGWLAKGVGWGVSMFQTGTVNTYAFILTVGVLVILGVSIL